MNVNNVKRSQIYHHMLLMGLPWLRNLLEMPWYKRIFNNSAFLLSQLMHYIPPRLLDNEKEVGKRDVEFIELGGSFFVENFENKNEVIFLILSDLILELYELIESQKLEINWVFPENIKELVHKFREQRCEPVRCDRRW